MSMLQLTNARGETVDLNSEKLFANTPTGLGVQFTNTYSQYETYFKATKSTVTQGQFQIYILFGDVESQSYQTFSDFAQFLAYQPLTLTYTTDSGIWYRDGRLNSLTKTEIGGSTVFATDRINESFTLEFINNWYNNKTAEYKSYDPDPNLGTYGKIYGNQIADTSIKPSQVNSKGQTNKLANTEFSPDFSGWFIRGYYNQDISKGGWVKGYPVNGHGSISHVKQPYLGNLQSPLVNATGAGKISISAVVSVFSDDGVGNSYITLDAFNQDGTFVSQIAAVFIQNGAGDKYIKLENITIPSNVSYVSLGMLSPSATVTYKLSQTMLVFDTTVGDYVQGLEYNHVATPAYTYAYAPYYVYMESTTTAGEKMLPLVNDSKYFGVQQGSPCIVTITGATTNPHWTVLQDGVTVATDGFTLTLADNQRLIVSSYPEDQYARVYNPDGSFADVSQLQDFTMTNFVQIPEGESTVLVYVDKDTGVNLTFKEERLLV